MENNTHQVYDENQIQVLEGLEAVRKRPGMYIGTTSIRGLHHLVYEIVDNSIDEALAGYCDKITVTVNKGNSVTVEDNGRGIPAAIHPKQGIPTPEVVYTILHAGGKFGGGGYKIAGGLHGVGASVVNALSEWVELDNCYEGRRYTERFEQGKVVRPFKDEGEYPERPHGVRVTFKPDATIFEETVFEYDILANRMREQAFLNGGIRIVLRDERAEDPEEYIETEFHYEGGIRSFVSYLNEQKVCELVHPEVIYMKGEKIISALADNTVFVDWEYSVKKAPISSLLYFKDLGIDIIGASWFDIENAGAHIDTISKNNLFGYMHTTWHTISNDLPNIISIAGKLGASLPIWKNESNDQMILSVLYRVVNIEGGDYHLAGWAKNQLP